MGHIPNHAPTSKYRGICGANHPAWLFILSIRVLDKSAFGLKEIDIKSGE
jgi:hypothetical protein